MTQPTSISTPAEQSHQTCRHYWLIEPPAGPWSPGVCHTCGEARQFKNWLDLPWDDHILSRPRAGSGERTSGLVDGDRENDEEE